MRPDWTTCFAQALDELGTFAERQSLEGAGSYYAWERLNILVRHLGRAGAGPEGEPDVRQARRAVESYARDLTRHYLKPDAWMLNWIEAFDRALKDAPEQPLRLTVSDARPAIGSRWGEAYLTVPAAWPEERQPAAEQAAGQATERRR